jgi:hypothetical protein
MLADLLLEDGAAAAALKEYEAVLRTAPSRFTATARAERAANRAADKTRARDYAMATRGDRRQCETLQPSFPDVAQVRLQELGRCSIVERSLRPWISELRVVSYLILKSGVVPSR